RASEQNLGTVSLEEHNYPKELTGSLYHNGVPIYSETQLADLIEKFNAEEVVLAYSDLSYDEVMRKSAIVNSKGADFRLMGFNKTMIKANKPVVSICSVRTGCGKSQISRRVYKLIKDKGLKVVAIREPMPYGDLKEQRCMRFETYEDLDKHKCTIEEREEYEPYIENGMVIYAGVDYAEIIKNAEKEADVIVWDGGNNEISFYKPDLLITIVDPHRPGHEISYFPGEVNARAADVIVVNKEDSAEKESIEIVKNNVKDINPNAIVIDANSAISVEDEESIRGKKVLVVEDGPTLTHGNMAFGAGKLAADKYGCIIVDPRPNITGSLEKVYKKFSHLGVALPAMGYSPQQINELEEVIDKTECDVVISGTPIDLTKILKINKPMVRVKYEHEDKGELEQVIDEFVKNKVR
ncbi:MAG: GTPase, partial [Candidatus Aenigmarchaeota archaeon]|nr:GTPase [Candidatus Aenigmarchaeota archaeon]